MTAYLKIIRPVNLLIIILTQAVILGKFADTDISNYLPEGMWIIIATTCTAAAGYVINDIRDIAADLINKPGKQFIPEPISKPIAWLMYVLITFVALGAAWQVTGVYFTYITAGITLLLLLYALWLKRLPLIGNLIVAAASAAVIGVCIPLIVQSAYFVLFSFTCFSFFVSLLRELVKDIEDVEGDTVAGYHTYPIFAGVKATKVLLYAITGVQIIMCGIFVVFAWGIQYHIVAILMGLIIIGFFFMIERLSKAREKGAFSFCSLLLKVLMFLGITCLAFT